MRFKLLTIRVLRRFASSPATHARLSSAALKLGLGKAVSIREILGFSVALDSNPRFLKLGTDWVQNTETGRVIWVGGQDANIVNAGMVSDSFITLLDD